MRVMRVMGVMGVIKVMKRRHTIENSLAQRDSEIYNLAGPVKTAPAQWDSGISILGMGLIGHMGHIGLMGQKPVIKNSPAQRHSKMSNLAGPGKTAPAQRDSGNSILGVGSLGILRSLGILGGKTKTENSPVQQDSKMILIKEALEG